MNYSYEEIFGKTFDEIFEDSFKKFSKHMSDDIWPSKNSALGMTIYSKEHLKHEMYKRKMLPYDQCQEMAQEWDKRNPTDTDIELSPKAESVIRSLKLTADSNGNISLGGRAIKALKELGAIEDNNRDTYNYSKDKGGFSDE